MSPIYINNKKIESIYTNNQSIGKVFVGDVLVFQKNSYNGDPFIFTIDTTLGTGASMTLPLRSNYNYNMIVDWGDGSTDNITSWGDINKQHTYATNGVYQVKISGICQAWNFSGVGDRLKVISIDQWGSTGFINMGSAFNGCTNLATANDTDGTWCSNVTNMSSMFSFCTSLTTLDVSNWNVSNVTNMFGMFNNCSSLQTLDVSNWNTSAVTNMNTMFVGCLPLQILDVSNWNTSAVTDMYFMFGGCSSLQTLDVSNWNTSAVTNMRDMFGNCSSLQTLDISNWDVSNVTDMRNMFNQCSSLTTLDVSNWNVSNVTNMYRMFYNCSSLTTLNLSGWNVENVLPYVNNNSMYQMFEGCQLSTASYDAALIAWSSQNVQSGVRLDAPLSQYSSGAATTARGILTSAPNNWIINDGGQL